MNIEKKNNKPKKETEPLVAFFQLLAEWEKNDEKIPKKVQSKYNTEQHKLYHQ